MAYYRISKLLEQILAQQTQMLSILNQLLMDENQMAVDISALTAQVTNNTSVTQSAIQLIQNIAAQLAAIPPSTDPTTQAALNALTTTLTQNDAALANAVMQNTSAAPKPAV